MSDNFSMKIFYTFLYILIGACAHAQFTYELNQDIEVEVDGNRLKFPWAGGIN